ncbi:aromatic ring-hydroxylating dioxygenase subunit alpha [Lagierella sp.]|uniref:aromatic ring-hydroxylating dioxygenase subunit alpha n=1 Tax=Lagierella sp. TaxID=2849657 RepID=UPI0026113E72|nr:aromatic ring-hydroxylating dioxygenase subunit alpha [Lagierella sp.]
MIKNKWYAILPSKDVKKNSPIGVKRLNSNLVLFRNQSGNITCLTDRCSHRGAALSKGVIKGNCIKCPFHGIEFDSKGDCKLIPALGVSNQSNLSRFNIEKHIVQEKYGIVFLWYGDSKKVTKHIPFFEDYIEKDFVYSELKDHWNTHYSRAIENQLDVVHLPFVHHNTIGRGNKTLVNGPKVEFHDYIMKTSADNEVDKGQKPLSNKDASIKKTNLNFIFPNIWLNNVTDKIKILIYFVPVDEENTLLYIRFYNRITKIKPIDSLIAFFGKIANKIVERQDKRVVVTQVPKKSGLKIGENLIPGDSPIIKYRQIREELQLNED